MKWNGCESTRRLFIVFAMEICNLQSINNNWMHSSQWAGGGSVISNGTQNSITPACTTAATESTKLYKLSLLHGCTKKMEG